MLPEDVDASEPSPKRARRSNGFETKVHASATPKPGLWLGAPFNESAAVVSLEQHYLPGHLKFTMDSRTEVCGCTRSPVGCAVWCLLAITLHLTLRRFVVLPSRLFFYSVTAVTVHYSAHSSLLLPRFSCLRGVIVFLSCLHFQI